MGMLQARTIAIVMGGLVLLGALVWFLISHGLLATFLNVEYSACHTDDEVVQTERQPYEAAALNFARTLLGGKADDIYAQFSDLARRSVGKDQTVAMVQTLQPLSGVSATLHLSHSYQHKISATGNPDEVMWSGCTLLAGGSSGDGEGDVQMLVLKVPLQAYVILEGNLNDTRYAIYVWLMPQGERWAVNYFYLAPVAIAGISGQYLRFRADEQAKKGHAFNALMLYRGAAAMLAGGPDFKYGLAGVVEKSALGLTLPGDVPLKMPYDWQTGGQMFQITSEQAEGEAQGVALIIYQELATGSDEAHLEARNMALLDALHAAHPEYKDAFTEVIVYAKAPGHDAYHRTVETVSPPP